MLTVFSFLLVIRASLKTIQTNIAVGYIGYNVLIGSKSKLSVSDNRCVTHGGIRVTHLLLVVCVVLLRVFML